MRRSFRLGWTEMGKTKMRNTEIGNTEIGNTEMGNTKMENTEMNYTVCKICTDIFYSLCILHVLSLCTFSYTLLPLIFPVFRISASLG